MGGKLKEGGAQQPLLFFEMYKHPVNQVVHDEASFGEYLADKIASFVGSWKFLIIQSCIVITWITFNLLGMWVWKWDPYPFILLNLAFSTQAAYTGPVLLLAGNRQSHKDRLTLEHAASEADRADVQNQQILKEIDANTQLTIEILNHIKKDIENATERGPDLPV